MLKGFTLQDEVMDRCNLFGPADIMVGIPSYNNAETIAFVAEMAGKGLSKYFGDLTSVIVNADGGSIDGTEEAFMNASLPSNISSFSFPYQGLSGKGSAFRSIFELASMLKTKVCIFLDSDLKSVSAEWIKLLAEPVLEDEVDYITPLYTRHKYDGTITNNICYPLIRALYGKKVRQPIGGDFGCSTPLLEKFLQRNVWESDVARFGIDIFMTVSAINEGSRLGQVHVGTKVHDQKDPAAHLGPMFKEVVGTFFSLMKDYESCWREVNKIEPIRVLGKLKDSLPVENVEVRLSALIDKFRSGYHENQASWKKIFSSQVYQDLKQLALLPDDKFNFPMELWACSVYELAAYYNHTHEKEKVIEALIPIYFGRTGDFVLSTMDLSSTEAEKVVENQCLTFEGLKPYLLQRWNENGLN